MTETTAGKTTGAVNAPGVDQFVQEFSYTQVAAGAAATFVIKASAGILHSIIFNGPSTATNVTTVYDHASGAGTVIAIPLTTGITVPVTMIFDVRFNTGLTIITTVANGPNFTVCWR